MNRKNKGFTCEADGCELPAKKRSLCTKHYKRYMKYGDVNHISIAPDGSGTISGNGYRQVTIDGHRISEHVYVAEKALGRALKRPEEVHHLDSNPLNNSNCNLVICPNNSYHKLLHRRQKALDACGNASWRKCVICKEHDSPERMYVGKIYAHHAACNRADQARRRKANALGAELGYSWPQDEERQ